MASNMCQTHSKTNRYQEKRAARGENTNKTSVTGLVLYNATSIVVESLIVSLAA